MPATSTTHAVASAKRQTARVVRKASDVVRLESVAPQAARRIRRWEASIVMDDRDALREFWTQPEPEGNAPASYIGQVQRSEVLAEIIADLPKDARILEVGTNVGRNLAYLYDAGWTQVEGIEISPHAVALLRSTYPQMEDRPIHLGAAEDILPTLEGPFGLVFTMAVLEHIHPDSASVFDDMARLAPRLVCIEPRADHISHRQFPHDIPEIFTGLSLIHI